MKFSSAKIIYLSFLISLVSLSLQCIAVRGDTTPPAGEVSPGASYGETNWGWKDREDVPPSASGGVNGPNRRVAIKGYIAVKGSFAEPQFDINPADTSNRPTYYLGLEGAPTQSDAGIQWEHERTGANPSPAGWVVFMAVNVDRGSLGRWRYYNNSDHYPKGSLGTVDLKLEPNQNGRITIYAYSHLRGALENFGPTSGIWPKDSEGGMNTTQMTARRVVGLTQGPKSNSWLAGTEGSRAYINQDGSWVKNLNFVNGEVGSGPATQALTYLPWQLSHDANPSLSVNKLLPNTRKNAKAPWIIDFRPPSSPRDKKTGAYNTTYSAENVMVDLRKVAVNDSRKAMKPGRGRKLNSYKPE